MKKDEENRSENGKKKKTSPALKPFRIYRKRKLTFLMWIAFSLFGGAFGIIVSILRHWIFTELGFFESIKVEFLNGALYTYSIALVASVLGAVFINFVDNERLKYRVYKVPLIVISIYILLFGGVMYALSIYSYTSNELASKEAHFSWGQFLFLVFALIISVYSFFVCRMDEHTDLFDDVVEQFQTKTNQDYSNNNNSIPENE